jgi:hypothetical protein
MDIIAERMLEIELPGEADKKVIRILLGKPEPSDPSGEQWGAPFEIHGPDSGEVVRRVLHGVDAMQALALALDVILPAELVRYERRGRVTHPPSVVG